MKKTAHHTDYQTMMDNEVTQFWQQRDQGYVEGVAGKKLFWVSLTDPQHEKAVVIMNGRVETVWKYQEIFYHLFTLGYDIYSFDHRGQGLSDRLTEDQQIGHVNRFSDYITDARTLIDSFDLKRYKKRFMLAHSMGGAISIRYIQTTPTHNFDGLLLSAPMLGVHLSPFIKMIAPYWANVISHCSAVPRYLTKNTTYKAKDFSTNALTSCPTRYAWFRHLYEQMPQLKLGGPSACWVWQSLTAAKECLKNTNKITIPILLLQAEKDVVVCNNDQITFISTLMKTNTDVVLETIKESQHEVLFERDEIRDIALKKLEQFLNNH